MELYRIIRWTYNFSFARSLAQVLPDPTFIYTYWLITEICRTKQIHLACVDYEKVFIWWSGWVRTIGNCGDERLLKTYNTNSTAHLKYSQKKSICKIKLWSPSSVHLTWPHERMGRTDSGIKKKEKGSAYIYYCSQMIRIWYKTVRISCCSVYIYTVLVKCIIWKFKLKSYGKYYLLRCDIR